MHRADEPSPPTLGWRLIWLGWLVVVLAYIPAATITAIINRQPAQAGLVSLQVAISFLPWVPVTPLIVRLCSRYPLGSGQAGPALAMLATAGLVILPVTAWTGTALAHLLAALLTASAIGVSPAQFAMAASATTLFMLPVYATAVGAGQTLAYLARDRARERQVAAARLDAIRAQIEPHFLFNLLNAIAALTHRDPAQADSALTELATMLRRSLTDDRDRIPLADEIDTAQREMALHRLLVPGPIAIETDIAQEAGDVPIPARLLRPLIENAITHGLGPMGGGMIAIAARIVDHRLDITIENAAPPGDAQPGLGLGLANVRDHLRATHGDGAAVQHEVANGTFRVSLSLPLPSPSEQVA